MPLRNTPYAWGAVHKTLHWLIALAVVGLLVVGWIMDEMPNSPDKIKVYALHKSFGLTVLALMTVRLAWRWINPRPALPSTMKGWERSLARIVHGGIYAALLAMPLSGWLFNSAADFPLQWFGRFTIPPLARPDRDLKRLAEDVHWALSWVIVSLVVLHVAGALKHHFVDRDDVLRRMLPGRRGAPPIAANPETAP